MQNPVELEIENIEEKRRLAGIDDVQLRMGIRGLAVGDFVRLTFAIGAVVETVTIRITSIHGYEYRGKLAKKPAARPLAKLSPKTVFTFSSDHIHSIQRLPALDDGNDI